MVKKRPQLNLDELQRLKWLLGGVLALISLSALLYLELDAWVLMAAGFIAVPLVLVRPDLPAYIPAWLHRLVFPGALAVSIYDFYAHAEPLPTLVRLAVFLLLYRACSYRRRRDDLQLVVLGLFPVVMAGVLTVSLAFAVQIVAFVACALLFLLLVTVVEAQLSGQPAASVSATGAPAWTRGGWRPLAGRVRAAADWRLFVLGGLLFAGLVVLSALLFLAIPRFQLESGFFLDRLLTRKSSTGFSDTLKFDDVIAIQQDNGVALRVEVSDRNRMPSVIYWRMVVLDEYRNGTFQLSAALKRTAFERETTGLRVRGSVALVRGAPMQWTFYLEPGVSRYLALAGGFSRLVFTEPQIYRRSTSLSLVELGRDPLAMKAYRVEGMQAGAVLQDLGNDALRAPTATTEDAPANPMLQLALDAEDRATLANAVREITGGAGLSSAEAFANAAMMWLAKKHAYSLDIELPKGAGDPLVRWLTSDRPGHCELFAGSFAILARAAGYPTRLVAGFMGGTWNEDYLIVRNSDAHAWCEIFDGDGRWLRVDPTNDGPRLLAGDRAGDTARAANLRTGGQSWSSRLDRLRLLWYRRIVNFDRGDQQELVQAFKLKVASSGHVLRVWLERSAEHVKTWFMRPWDVQRWGRALGFSGAVAALVWVLWRFGPGWWRRVRGSWQVGRSDPVRREAGRWLQRLDALGQTGGCAGVRDDLLRVRYGPRESWSVPARVFAEARKAERALRRRARR